MIISADDSLWGLYYTTGHRYYDQIITITIISLYPINFVNAIFCEIA